MLGPLLEQRTTFIGQLVAAALGAVISFRPGGGDKTFLLESAQNPVHTAGVDADETAAQFLDGPAQLVAVTRLRR